MNCFGWSISRLALPVTSIFAFGPGIACQSSPPIGSRNWSIPGPTSTTCPCFSFSSSDLS